MARAAEARGRPANGSATRLVLALLIAQVAGILWADRGGAGAEWLGPAAAAGAVVAAMARTWPGVGAKWAGRGVLLGLVGLAFALAHQSLDRTLVRARADADRAEQLDPKRPRLVDARVSARRTTRFAEEVELVDVRSRAGDERVPERLLLRFTPEAGRADRLLRPGARVRLGLSVSPLRPPRNPGSPDAEHALARRGFSARARLVKPDWVVLRIDRGGGPARLGRRLERLRWEIAERVRQRLAAAAARDGPAPGAALVCALALGDRSALAEPTREALRGLGLAHLISVSGLHVGFVAMPAAWAVVRLRVCGRPRRWPVRGFVSPLMVGCAVAGCYAWLTGAGVPALRASLVFALVGIGRAAGIRIRPVPALASVALVLLFAEPALLFDLGARLSFAACAALVAGGIWGGQRDAVRAAWGLAPIRVSLAVSIGMLPLIEWAGLPRALPSPLVNALAIPWTGLVVLPAALAAAMLAIVLPVGIGDPVVTTLLLPAAALERSVLAVFARMPADAVDADALGRLPWSLALPVAAIALWRLRRGAWRFAALAWVALASLGLAPLRAKEFPNGPPRVVFLDVGQADAALVQTPEETWLIDTGGGPVDGSGGRVLLRALAALGVDRVDVLVVTHGDLDHRGGAIRVLSAVNVSELWLPAALEADAALAALADFAAQRGVRVRRVAAGDRRGAKGAPQVEVLWPPRPLRPTTAPNAATDAAAKADGAGAGARAGGADPGSRRLARNEGSIVLRLTVAGSRLLFAADVGIEVERRLIEGGADLRSDVLKVGHHGSRTSSDARFLAAVSPQIAIVSAPCIAGRGLPSGLALDRLRSAGAGIGWTGRDGAIAIALARDPGSEALAAGATGAVPLRMRYWGAERRCVPDRAREGTRMEAR